MRRFALLSVVVAFGVAASPAFAQNQQTWVSGVGNDASATCSRTDPCKTFSGAIGKTNAGGVIEALDDGGFGALTITKSITVDGGSHLGGMLASGGINAINIAISAAAPSQDVVLRNLDVEGNGTTLGLNGVRIVPNGGRLTVDLQNLRIADFTRAGVFVDNGGVDAQVDLSMTNVVVEGSGSGLNIPSPAFARKVNALVEDSVFENLHVTGPLTNGAGVLADTGAHVWLTGSTIFGNDVGLRTAATNGAPGVIDSFCDNQIGGNADNGPAPNQLCPQPQPPQTRIETRDVLVRQCIVPRLKGLQLSFAKKLLKAAGCTLGKVSKKATRKRKQVGKVMAQKVRAGSTLSQGAKVGVTVGKRARRRR
jgi:hypothetical protein